MYVNFVFSKKLNRKHQNNDLLSQVIYVDNIFLKRKEKHYLEKGISGVRVTGF